jgi:hypothetical protein
VPKQIYDGNPGTTAPLVQATYGGIHEDAMHADMWKPTLAWFRWQLMADTTARALFYPAGTCGLCQDANWTAVRSRREPRPALQQAHTRPPGCPRERESTRSAARGPASCSRVDRAHRSRRKPCERAEASDGRFPGQ